MTPPAAMANPWVQPRDVGIGGRTVGTSMRYHFGDHTLDLAGRRLLVNGDQDVHLEPRTFAVLVHLVAHRHRVVPKEELLDDVWGDRFVTDSALTTRVKRLRRAIGDDGSEQRVIRTVHGVGYQFVAEVEESPGDRSAGAERGRAVGDWPMPSPVVPVLGRDEDIDALLDRVEHHRLVTVTGLGGIGKTTLALAAVGSGRLGTPAGWWCDLATTRTAAVVPTVVLHGVGGGQQEDVGPLGSLLRALERRSGVLVLDNCEHVAGATAALVRNVLRGCPSVRLIATTRMPLGVPGESVLPLGPLSVDDAVRCFVDRARDAGGAVDRADPAVPELCRRLDGIPLALELAAARSRLFAPAQLVPLLGDRFRLLAGARHRADDRHGSLRAAIAWSWDQLEPEERALLARLTALVGPFTTADAAAVAGAGDVLEVISGLDALVRGSLVATAASTGREPRFRLLESIREFAAEQLADEAATQRRHAEHFAKVAEQLDMAMQGEAIDQAVVAMAGVWDNVRAAVRYAHLHGDLVTLQRIIRATGPYADLYQAYEVLDWCDMAGVGDGLRDAADVALAADAQAVRARMLAHRGHHEQAAALAGRALACHESRTTLLTSVWCAYYAGDLDHVLIAADRLAELSRSSRGMDRGFAEGFAAVVATVRQVADIHDSPVAPSRAEEGLLGAIDCLVAGFRLFAVDPATAAELLEAVLQVSLRKEYRLLQAAAGSTLVQIALPAQPVDVAMRTMQRTLAAYRDRGMWTLISADVVMAAKLLADVGDETTAARLLGSRAASGYRTGLSEVLRRALEAELARRDSDRLARLCVEGAGLRPPEAADVAIEAMQRHLDALAR